MSNEDKLEAKERSIIYSKDSKNKSQPEENLIKAVQSCNVSEERLKSLDQVKMKLSGIDLKKVQPVDRFEKYFSSKASEQTEEVYTAEKEMKNENSGNKKKPKIKKSKENLENYGSVEHDKTSVNENSIEFIHFNEPVVNEGVEQVVEDRIEEIRNVLRNNSVVLVQGNTGCGKTTKIPKFLMDEYPNIVCTQPRRLAAINVARKVASDLGCAVGSTIGYSIRFEDVTSKQTKLKFVTDGILVKEIISRSNKKSEKIADYDLIIIDEAHERSINIDYLLGYIKQCLKSGECKTKLLIMSATMNSEKFAEYYGCPIITIKHKIFPLEYFYLTEDVEDYLSLCIKTTIQIIESHKNGDILVFLTGQDEIEKAYLSLSIVTENSNIAILKLYSSISPEEQDLVFQKKNRKVVLCTNIAETSITIETVKFVVDSGKFKCKRHSTTSSVDYLEILDVSAAQAKQRAGRAGRTSAGVVYRIYSREKYLGMEENPVPEILRSRISSVILSMKSLGIHDVNSFDYIDKPPEDSINSAQQMLYYLRAIDSRGYITKFGREISKMPLDPEMATTLYIASKIGCLNSVATIAAFLEYQTPFLEIKPEHPAYSKYKNILKTFAHPKGDFYSFLIIYQNWEKTNFSFEFLKRNFLCVNAMIQIKSVRSQILKYFAPCRDTTMRIEEAFCSGFFMNVAKIDDKSYRTVFGENKCFIHPKDGLSKSFPTYIIFFELFCIRKRYMRHCLEIDPHTLHLCVNYGLEIKKAF